MAGLRKGNSEIRNLPDRSFISSWSLAQYVSNVIMIQFVNIPFSALTVAFLTQNRQEGVKSKLSPTETTTEIA